MSSSRNPACVDQGGKNAFTLIELILVMTLLVVTAALVTPKMAGFFNGRKVDSEARRILSLTRYGQSRAVSEGIPMMLWVNPKAGSYGLRQETGYTDSDTKQVDYTVNDNVTLGVDGGNSKMPSVGKSYGIHFSPDGNIVTATSVKGISVREGKRPATWIVPSNNGLAYELRTDRN